MDLASVIYESKPNELIDTLHIYSTVSQFAEDIWVLDKLKRKGLRMTTCTIYFRNTPDQYIEISKHFALQRLNKRICARTVSGQNTALKRFWKFLESEFPNIELCNIDKGVILAYQDYLEKDNEAKKSTKEGYWTAITMFFREMGSYLDIPSNIVGKYNPFSRTAQDRLLENKYIPIDVINQLDKVFYNENIPLSTKTCYWICRLIPSRINEVVSIPIDCIRQYGDQYTLTLNMYKQNGGYIVPEKRLIGFKNEGMGAYLLKLIRKQQRVARLLQCHTLEKDLLFTYIRTDYTPLRIRTYRLSTKNTSNLSDNSFARHLRKIIEMYNVKDANGEMYRLSSHQLRHNAITDRVYEGFTLLEVKDLTHHKSTAMIVGSYLHPDKERTIAKIRKVNNQSQEEVFRGKIISDNIRMLERIKNMPRSQSLGRLGVCSDITGCKNDMYECLACEFFVPNVEELDLFEEQVIQWKEKIERFKGNQYIHENAEYNLKLNEEMVIKIKKMIEAKENE